MRSESWAQHAADASRFRRTPEAQADIAAARAAPTTEELFQQALDAERSSPGSFDAEIRARFTPAEAARRATAAAAASAAPTGIEVAMQEIDRAAEHALHEHRNTPTAYRAHGDPPVEVTGLGHHGIPLDAALSNAALADTPAVREMGGPALPPEASVVRGSIRVWRRPGGNVGIDTTHVGSLIRDTGAGPHIVIERADVGDAAAALLALEPTNAVLLTGPEAERYRAITAAARKAQASSATARADSAALLQLFQAFCAGVAPGRDG